MMSDIIQVNYEQLARVAERFSMAAESSAELRERLMRDFTPLEQGGWVGRGSASFCAEMHSEVFPAMDRLIAALHAAQQVTLDLRSLFQRAEEDAAAPFQGTSGDSDSPADSLPAWFEIAEFIYDFLILSKDAYEIVFKTSVSQANILKILEVAEPAFFAMDVVVGVIKDVLNKEYTINGTNDIDWTKTIGVNFIDTGITTAIAATEVGTVVLLVNAGVQVGGTIELAIQEAYNNWIATDTNRQLLGQDVAIAKEALDRADFGKVTKSTAELVYTTASGNISNLKSYWDLGAELFRNPSMETLNKGIATIDQNQDKIWNDNVDALKKVGLSTAQLVDGVEDLPASMGGAIQNTTIATGNSIIQHLPIDGSIKSAVDNLCTDWISSNQQHTKAVVDTWDFSSSDWKTWLKRPSSW